MMKTMINLQIESLKIEPYLLLKNRGGLYVKSTMEGYCAEKTIKIESLEIKKVIFRDRATIVLWNDGTKTVVKCNERDTYDPEKGFAMAISEKVLGSHTGFKREMAKWEDHICEEKP